MRRRLSPVIALGLGAALLAAPAASLPAAIAAPAAAIVDSPVDEVYDAQVAPDGTTYAVGDFTEVGAATGGMARLAASAGAVDRAFPTVNGRVFAMTRDSSGAIYIGGDFLSVGGEPRAGLARIDADGTVDSWAPTVGASNSRVTSLAVVGTTIYVGGSFTEVNGQGRQSLAAVDTQTGALLSWNPGVSGFAKQVDALVTDDTHLYVGGSFTSIAGQNQGWIAAFTLSDMSLNTSWNPDLGGYGQIYAVAAHDGVVYIGGEFTTVDAQPRNRLASLDANTGTPTTWDPSPSGSVGAISIDDTVAYVGGNFTTINGGVARTRLAALNTDDTGTVTSWTPSPVMTTNVSSLLVTDTSVYAGAGTLEKLDRTTGAVDGQWQPRVSSPASFGEILDDGASLIVGGTFTHVNVVERNGAAAFDSSMRLTSWDPNIAGTGYRIALVNSTAYVVGSFTTVNGSVNRDYAAAFRMDDTGTATSWAPVLNSYPYDMDVEGSIAYLVGDFSDINGATRNYAGAVRLDDTGSVTAWDPDIGGSAYAIAVDNGVGYIGGSFPDVKGGTVSRNNVAAFSTSGSGAPTSWDPDANSDVSEILIHDGLAYLGGGFDRINDWGGTGVVRWRAAAVTLDDSGVATSWDPDIQSGDVYAIQISGDHAYVSGSFHTVNGSVPRTQLAAISIDDTGTVSDSWVPRATGGFSYGASYEGGLRLVGDRLLVMGSFTMATLDGADYPGALAALPTIPSVTPVPPAPTPPSSASPPRDVQAEAGDRMARVTWEAPAQSGSFPITSYQVTSVPGGHVCLVAAPALTCDVSGLSNGTEYTFTVKALTGAGWSAASGASNAVVPQESATPSLVITGSRDGRLIVVTGSSTGMGMGAILKPWVRMAGQSAFREGAASILVDADGTFQWQRRSGKRASVYVATPDGSWRSNRVIIPVR